MFNRMPHDREKVQDKRYDSVDYIVEKRDNKTN